MSRRGLRVVAGSVEVDDPAPSARRHLLGTWAAPGLSPSDLSPSARTVVSLVEALDRILLGRGWVLDVEMAGLCALTWCWPPSGPPAGELYAGDGPEAHELQPCTAVSLFLDHLPPTDLHVTRVGDCTHCPDRLVAPGDLQASLDALEAYRFRPRPVHICWSARA